MLEQAPKDFLTGFFSREAMNPFLENFMRNSLSNKKVFSVALIDLDHFKRFNDKYGHLFGDEVLKYAVSTIRLTFQGYRCYPFRYGGDEFIVIFPDKEPKEIYRLLRQCTYNLRRRPFLLKNKFYKVTFSCGIVGFPSDEKTLEKLILKADKAMYFSKGHGRNLITLAGRLKYLKLRSISLFIGSVCFILLSLFTSYHLVFKEIVKSAFRQIGNTRIITKPRKLDTIILTNGEVYEGRILEETEDRVVLSLYLEKGEGTVIFEKSEVSTIKYDSKTPSQKEDKTLNRK